MKSFIFMNHHIKDKKNKEPWITIQTGEKRIHCNVVRIDGPSAVYTGLLADVDTHEVKAWIECDYEDVIIME